MRHNRLLLLVVLVALAGCPRPRPQPEPKPQPAPPQPVTERLVVIVEESSERTADQATLIFSPVWRLRAAELQSRVILLDRDVTDESGQPPVLYAGFLTLAKGNPLPYLILADPQAVRHEGPLPAGAAEIVTILDAAWGTR